MRRPLLVVKMWVWELLPTCNLHSVRTDALLAVMKKFYFPYKKLKEKMQKPTGHFYDQ